MKQSLNTEDQPVIFNVAGGLGLVAPSGDCFVDMPNRLFDFSIKKDKVIDYIFPSSACKFECQGCFSTRIKTLV